MASPTASNAFSTSMLMITPVMVTVMRPYNFALDFSYTSLPSTAMHKHHKHPLDLTYRDATDRIYNNICEEDISPKHWFYYCKA
ncbi:C1-like protein [Gossypium australe]|uniref:C1-like protein n=1 Tax=Gossypium australe TaxID=47621 RepID=A0A5B6VSZ1_9ROSI|nr:C1-like protein [Gossypium australe]